MLTITAEPLAGDKLEHVAQEMCVLAKKLGVGICVSFNSVHLIAFPETSPNTVQLQYYSNIKERRKYDGN